MSAKRKPNRQPPIEPRPAARGGWALVVALLLAAGLVAWWWPGRGDDVRPLLVAEPGQNLLLITIDTLRADALGAYGGRAATPHLDRLASSGVRYTSAHAHAVMTLPSHASIMTGRHPFEHGVRDNAGFRLADSAGTLAASARQKSMSTGAFVGAFPLDRQFGLAQGFDLYDDVGGREVAQGELALTERRAEDVVAEATAWIARQGGPWFAWVHVFDPHAPYAPPPPFASDYASDPYAGEVAYVDHALGPLLDLAGRASRRTTVVVTSDHGEGLGEHGELTHGTFAYESTLRVPLIIAQVGAQVGAPDRSGAHEALVIDAPARHIDIFPTIAALLHLDVPAALPGRSLLPPGPAEPVTTYFEAMSPMLTRGWAPLRGVIVDRHKYIELPIEEVYDLASDPRESRNLAPGSDRLPALAVALDRLDAALPGTRGGESAEVRARLESLGYLSGAAARKARYTEDDDPKRLIELDRLMLEGLALFGTGRSADAVQAYLSVIARRPDMNVAYRRLASIQWESGQPREAIATLREALARNGPDIDIDVRLGTYLAETGAADEAIRMLERVTAADPRHTEGLNALGIAHAQAGRPADALRAFARALEADPRSPVSLENAATVHLQRGDAAAARDAFVRALELDPRSSRAHAGLGVVELRAGRQDAAIAAWRRAVELDPSNFDALFNLATELVNAGRVSEARPFIEQFVRRAPPAFYGPDIARLRRVLE
jgi:arylsulfatase A-like enzyme/tetratricopeptide (TPR) repeat protein